MNSSGTDSTSAAPVATRQRSLSPKRAGSAPSARPTAALTTPIAAYTMPAWPGTPNRAVREAIPAWQAPNMAPWRAREPRTAWTTRGWRGARTPSARARAEGVRAPRQPRVVHAVRGSLALQGAMFGACQAGIASLTARLGVPGQAGIVYAAMGVVSAAVGLALGALPARFGLRLRWRVATGAALVLSVPLLFTQTLWPLYAVVTVLGAAYAPHLITAFALTERVLSLCIRDRCRTRPPGRPRPRGRRPGAG